MWPLRFTSTVLESHSSLKYCTAWYISHIVHITRVCFTHIRFSVYNEEKMRRVSAGFSEALVNGRPFVVWCDSDNRGFEASRASASSLTAAITENVTERD